MMNVIKLSLFILILLLNFSYKSFSNENSASIFVYHRFGENNFPTTNIQMGQFKKHLNELEKNNYNVIPIHKIIDSLINKKELPVKTIGISIDDAFLSIYKKAWPLLKKKKIPFTIFVSTGSIGDKPGAYMSWKQIKEMSDSGVAFGNHTKNHLHLVNHDEDKIINEIEEANEAFLKNLGFKPDIFAYPYGEHSEKVKEIAKKYFKATFGQQSGVIYNKIDMFNLPRFSLNERYGDIKRFKFAANSLALPIKDIVPSDRVIKDINPPLLGFTLINKVEGSIKCYPSHSINENLIKIGDNRIEVRFNKKFPTGRTRINCTSNDNGKWRWYGFQFINP